MATAPVLGVGGGINQIGAGTAIVTQDGVATATVADGGLTGSERAAPGLFAISISAGGGITQGGDGAGPAGGGGASVQVAYTNDADIGLDNFPIRVRYNVTANDLTHEVADRGFVVEWAESDGA